MKLTMHGVAIEVETSQGTVSSEWHEAVMETTPSKPKQEGNRAWRRRKRKDKS